MAPLSRLRMSPHYGALSKFHASDDEDVARLDLQVPEAAVEEVGQICKHLDLTMEALPTGAAGGKRCLVIRRCIDLPEEDPEMAAAARQREADAGQLPSAPVNLDPREPTVPAGSAGPAEAPGTRRPERAQERSAEAPAVVEVEAMLDSAPEGLVAFYRALVSSFPGYHLPMAKLLGKHLRAAGLAQQSSDESSSAKKKKKKKAKKEEKKARKAAKKEAKKEKKAKKDKGKKKAKGKKDKADECLAQPAGVESSSASSSS
eukprot:TRINITY_DN306_c1_g1_i1.p2 TRINITY_DN306_c1_g1~~TRINITY_DN306_c1_g1_i1.p2  ORF type:complete len:260 (-),score=85.68 TRINITY_DN306_c1_g1_i1:216-995(-)